MRSLFIQYADKLQNGRYIFVAKEAINSVEFSKIEQDFKYIIRKANALKK